MGHREDLLEGAKRCLLEKGFVRTTARDIVTESGTNLASIGYHYGSKDALLAQAYVALTEGPRTLRRAGGGRGRQLARLAGAVPAGVGGITSRRRAAGDLAAELRGLVDDGRQDAGRARAAGAGLSTRRGASHRGMVMGEEPPSRTIRACHTAREAPSSVLVLGLVAPAHTSTRTTRTQCPTNSPRALQAVDWDGGGERASTGVTLQPHVQQQPVLAVGQVEAGELLDAGER